jgi:glyoxylase-like metal-dependent hydrolase (beta-lactamase superfamily II)
MTRASRNFFGRAAGLLIVADLFGDPVPYVCSGYPSEWAETLQKIVELNPRVVIPGHGDVLSRTNYVAQVARLLRSVVSEVRNTFYEKGNGLALELVRKTVESKLNFEKLRRESDGGVEDNLEQSEAIKSCLVKNAYFEESLR